MVDKNKLFERYLFDVFKEFDESTLLTPDLNGQKDIEKSDKSIFEFKNDNISEFCEKNSIDKNILFLAGAALTLNKFNFNHKNLIFHENDYFFTTNFKNRDISIKMYLAEIQEDYLENMGYADCPIEGIYDKYNISPKFYYSFNKKPDADSLKFKYSCYLGIVEDADKFILSLSYDSNLYSRTYIDSFLKGIGNAVNQFLSNDPDELLLSDIALVDECENVEFSEVPLPFMHKRFEKVVREKPDEIALVATDGTLTYAQLNERANRIANGLIKKGVKPRSNILIMLPRDSSLIASIIGVLKAGCAFIPIDLNYPNERIKYIYENSRADYILDVDGDISNSLSVKVLLEEGDISNPDADVSPEDLAYMIYTSGSTGSPKGVMISHRNICNQTDVNPMLFYNSILCISTIAFDASLEGISTAISHGIKLILANDDEIRNIVDLIDLINREKPEIMDLTPSRALSYFEVKEFCDAVKCFKGMFFGGEKFTANVANEFRKYSDATIYNCYGPTETTIASNFKEITDSNDITVGKAVKNYVTDVRDIDGKLLPDGVIGELYIGGLGVGKGYYNMEEKTREVFLTINDIPYYRSGDYAVRLPNGEIDIKGRIDNQIKLRGLRIEIGEIESNISKFPKIKQNAVVIRKIHNNDHLCAYFTADEKIDKEELKKYLFERLAQYMVPTVFMQLDEMPETLNGKVDLKLLPEPEMESDYVAPATELEQRICWVFGNVLGLDLVGAEDNFFEIGGTSLLASNIIIQLLKQDYLIKFDDIFKNQTPRKLAHFLTGGDSSVNLEVEELETYDYSKINRLLEENTIENFRNGENRKLGNVLLTGVTGFLGIHLLYEYVKNEDGTIYCMLRKGEFDSPEDRLCDLMDFYFDEDLTGLIGNRIVPVEGDITNFDDFKKFEDYPIDTLINSAAVVKHYAHDDYIFRVNVDGVINGLVFSEENNLRYVQISTISVVDLYKKDTDVSNILCDEKTLYWGQDLSNVYVNSKFLAEKMILERALHGLDAKIIRLGNLMGRYSDGVFQKNFETNAFLNNIKSIKNLKAINPHLSQKLVEFSPIDYVARAVLLLSKTPKESRIFYCENNKFIPVTDIIDALKSFGYDVDIVPTDEFKKIFKENLGEGTQGLIMDDLSIDGLDFEDDSINVVNMDQSLEILNSLGFEWPETDENYLKQLFGYLNTVNYFV